MSKSCLSKYVVIVAVISFGLIVLKFPGGRVSAQENVINNQVVFSAADTEYSEIYAMDSDGSQIIQLTDNTAVDTEPRISRDGSKIVFTSDRDENFEIYSMDIKGDHLARLTSTTTFDGSPSWSADGSQIAYIAGSGDTNSVYVMNADGSHPVDITNSSANEIAALWSPDGNKIAFVSNRSGSYQIYTIDSDGTELVQLTAIRGDISTHIEWSPDSTKIAFRYEGQIYYVAASRSDVNQITDGGDIGSFFWLNNTQIVFIHTASGWISSDIDGSTWNVINLDWPTNADTFSFPPSWQPPLITANLPPSANAGTDQLIQTDPIISTTSATVVLNGSGIDSDGQISRFYWYEDEILLASGPNPEITLDVGTHHLTLVVTDDREQSSRDDVVFTITLPTLTPPATHNP